MAAGADPNVQCFYAGPLFQSEKLSAATILVARLRWLRYGVFIDSPWDFKDLPLRDFGKPKWRDSFQAS